MSKFNIGDKVISKGYPNLGEEVGVVVGIDTRGEVEGKYLVKFNSLDISSGWVYGVFRNDPNYLGESYEGYADWVNEDDLVKVEEECEEEKCKEGEICMSEFNIGDKVISNDSRYSGKDVGVIIRIDPREDAKDGKYLVKFDSLDASERYAMWLDNLIKVEEESEEECEEDKHEEDIKMEFDKIREQKKEVIKEISEKVLEMTLEIKEMEHEIEKIKKEWHLD